MCVRVVESRNTEKSHIPELFVALAGCGIAAAGGEAAPRLCNLGAGQQTISLRDREFLFPLMTLPVGRNEGVGHLLLFRSGGLETTAVHLWDIGEGVLRECQRVGGWRAVDP